MIAAILGNWKWGAAGLVVAAALIFAWQANEWKHRAAQAAVVERQLAAEIAARKRADEARTLAEAQLEQMVGETRVEIREIVKRVPVVVNNSRECDLGLDALRLLNEARGHPAVSGPSGERAGPVEEPPPPG